MSRSIVSECGVQPQLFLLDGFCACMGIKSSSLAIAIIIPILITNCLASLNTHTSHSQSLVTQRTGWRWHTVPEEVRCEWWYDTLRTLVELHKYSRHTTYTRAPLWRWCWERNTSSLSVLKTMYAPGQWHGSEVVSPPNPARVLYPRSRSSHWKAHIPSTIL